MKVNEIERLLTRYYDGETSETEEKELKRFFTEEDVPAHLLAEKEIFISHELMARIQVSPRSYRKILGS